MVFWNKNAFIKFREYFRITSSINILHGAEVDINCKHLSHVQQCVQFFPIISLEISKVKAQLSRKRFNDIPWKFRNNSDMSPSNAGVSTEFLITLNDYGSTWHFLNFRHYKSMAISADEFKVGCFGNGPFKPWITFRIHTCTPLLVSGGIAIRWKMFSALGDSRHVLIATIITLWRFWHEFSMPLTWTGRNEISRNFQDRRNDDLFAARACKRRDSGIKSQKAKGKRIVSSET